MNFSLCKCEDICLQELSNAATVLTAPENGQLGAAVSTDLILVKVWSNP